MYGFKRLMLVVAVAAAAFTTATTALAGGEPKNEYPFTRSVDTRTLAASQGAAVTNPRSEPKNERPFTSRR